MSTPDTRINLRGILWYSACPNFMSEQPDRFSPHAGPDPFDPVFADGVMHFCSTNADAYLLVRDFEADGIPVTLLVDEGAFAATTGNPDFPKHLGAFGVQFDQHWVVLTAPYEANPFGTGPSV